MTPMNNWKKIVPLITSHTVANMLEWIWKSLFRRKCGKYVDYLLVVLWKLIASMRKPFNLNFCSNVDISLKSVRIERKCWAHALKYSPFAKKKLPADMETTPKVDAKTKFTQKTAAQPENVNSLNGVLCVPYWKDLNCFRAWISQQRILPNFDRQK